MSANDRRGGGDTLGRFIGGRDNFKLNFISTDGSVCSPDQKPYSMVIMSTTNATDLRRKVNAYFMSKFLEFHFLCSWDHLVPNL